MKSLDSLLMLLLVASSATVSLAQPPQPGQRPRLNPNQQRQPSPSMAFRFLDRNRDGYLTSGEVSALRQRIPQFRDNPDAFRAALQSLDANGDSRLSLQEFEKLASYRQGGNNRPSSNERAEMQQMSNTRSMRSTNNTAAVAHFEKKIRPVLVGKCYECHSADADEIGGSLLVDTREGLLRGGDNGPAVVPGKVEESLLIQALRHEDGLEMPQDEKLSDEIVADFVKWIEAGAIDPRKSRGSQPTTIDMKEGRKHWAFQPPRIQNPEGIDEGSDWVLSEIDKYVLAAQQEHGVVAVEEADASTMVRRLYFDIIGLPPSPLQAEMFEQAWNVDPEKAIADTVDKLLASNHFGERWGRHWLDVARYAESSGKEVNVNYKEAWRYRDYVIDALNADKPYDDFLREQLAGDLMPTRDPKELASRQIATGFLAIGAKSHNEQNRRQFEADVIDEQIDTVSQSLLGMTVACARCHDHKFDPIPQQDYYALAGIFQSTDVYYGTERAVQNRNPSRLIELDSDSGVAYGRDALGKDELESLRSKLAEAEEQLAEFRRKRRQGENNDIMGNVRTSVLASSYRDVLSQYDDQGNPKLLAMGVREARYPSNSPVYIRGEVDTPSDIVPRGFLQVISDRRTPTIRSGSGRKELADWVASPRNPLTARVLVNRVWQHLLGQGLVATPDNFGISGETPTHPELLDYLAVTFVKEDEWSIKQLIRRITMSRVYRLSSSFDESNFEVDPDNVYLWRMSPARLDAEAIRDGMLAVAGSLELDRPIGSTVSTSYGINSAFLQRGGQLEDRKYSSRAIYLPAIRGTMLESLDVFNGVDGSMVVGKRDQTLIPAQSLYLMNSTFVLRTAHSAAERLVEEESDPRARVNLAYERFFNRPASEEEIDAAIEFMEAFKQEQPNYRLFPKRAALSAWSIFCQSLWASGEFLIRK